MKFMHKVSNREIVGIERPPKMQVSQMPIVFFACSFHNAILLLIKITFFALKFTPL